MTSAAIAENAVLSGKKPAIVEKILVSGPESTGLHEIRVTVSDEVDSKILAFLARQDTIVIGSKAGAWSAAVQGRAEKLLSRFGLAAASASRGPAAGPIDLKTPSLLQLSRLVTSASERAIVSTVKRRGLRVRAAVAAMKSLKFAHEVFEVFAKASRRAIYRGYRWYVGGKAVSAAYARAIVLFHDASLALSEGARHVSVAIQNRLLSLGYYYKEQVFPDDLLHTVARELVAAYAGRRITIRGIQAKFQNVSYRVAYKIWAECRELSAAPAA